MIAVSYIYNYASTSDQKRFAIWIGIIVYSFIIGCRYDVGIDYLNYKRFFDYSNLRSNIETIWLTQGIKYIGGNYLWFFIIMAFLQISFFLFSFKDKRFLLTWATFFFFVTLEFFLSMNVMRQVLAWCIFLYSIKFIIRRQLNWYLIWIAFACLFHFSAIVLLIFYFLPLNKIPNRKLLFCIYFSLFIFGITFQTQLALYLGVIANILNYNDYGDNILRVMETINFAKENSLGLARIFWVILDCTAILLVQKLQKKFELTTGFNNYFILFFLGVSINYIFEGTILDRVTMYFLPFRIVVYAYLFYYLYSLKRFWSNIYVFSAVIALIFFYIYSGIIGDASGCTPFKFSNVSLI